ncbi:MAG: SprT-like domain-containing protein [Chthonomonas sp.]|nr:SprT-like domain-containing protein [Chthonomonas sp.]
MTEAWQDELAATTLAECWRRFPLRRSVSLEWRAYRTTAGMADLRRNVVLLGPKVLNTPEKLVATLRHEYAHLMAVDRHGLRGRGHGAAWTQAMADLGEPCEVYHRYECQRNQARRVIIYHCAKCGLQFQRRRQLPRRGKYLHRGCGGLIRLQEIVPVAVSAE